MKESDNSGGRTVLALGLSLVVLFAYYVLVSKYYGTTPPLDAPLGQFDSPTAATATASPAGTATVPAEGGGAPTTATDVPAAADIPEEFVEINTGLMRATLSNRGAVLQNVRLTDYTASDKRPVDVAAVPPELVKVLALVDSNGEPVATANYQVTLSGPNVLSAAEPETRVRFEGSLNGSNVTKELVFHHDSYTIGVTVSVIGAGAYSLALGATPIWVAEEHKLNPSSYNHIGPVFLAGTERESPTLGGQSAAAQFGAPERLSFFGWESAYFGLALAPHPGQALIARLWPRGEDYLIAADLPRDGSIREATLYAGPKKLERLAAASPVFEQLVDFGTFSILSRPLLFLLNYFYRYVANYGICIILLTVLVRVLFFPLTSTSFKSMRKMQKLQPKMKALRERFKKDPQRMNEEMMKLFKDNKVNHLSGCLPMLLQLPVFFALYNTFYVAIELRGAPFFLWINDLSEKDPYYVTPIIMGITMVIQQRMTPMQGDPRQAQIMAIMPIIFTFMFLKFPSGLVLYWLVSNLLTIAQQYVLNKSADHGDGEPAAKAA
ncbi:MAG: membrane protein insertase YidC [Candidatus Schekmanbacteria bacterium]|nr:membrane protein insertase YidC [Candidatus Schekmanbacteria bacterium]